MKLNPQYTAIASQDQPMNALQPTTSVYNIGYDAPSQNGAWICISLMLQPKAKDSFNSQWTSMVKRQEKQYTETKVIPATKVNGKDVKILADYGVIIAIQ